MFPRTPDIGCMHGVQQKSILQKTLPEELKLSIAKKIENNLFSKVLIYVGLIALSAF